MLGPVGLKADPVNVPAKGFVGDGANFVNVNVPVAGWVGEEPGFVKFTVIPLEVLLAVPKNGCSVCSSGEVTNPTKPPPFPRADEKNRICPGVVVLVAFPQNSPGPVTTASI